MARAQRHCEERGWLVINRPILLCCGSSLIQQLAVDKDCSGYFRGNCSVLIVPRFLGLFIPSIPLVSDTLIQTNGANDVLPISCVHAPRPCAHPGCLNEMDLSASLWCRTLGLIELHIPPPELSRSRGSARLIIWNLLLFQNRDGWVISQVCSGAHFS